MKRLTEQEVLNIYQDSEGTYKEIGKRHGVSASCVTHIKTGLRHSDITNASEGNNDRRKRKYVNKEKAQAVYDFINDPEEPRTKEEASIYFNLPPYTIRRILVDYVKKYHIRHVKNKNVR